MYRGLHLDPRGLTAPWGPFRAMAALLLMFSMGQQAATSAQRNWILLPPSNFPLLLPHFLPWDQLFPSISDGGISTPFNGSPTLQACGCSGLRFIHLNNFIQRTPRRKKAEC